MLYETDTSVGKRRFQPKVHDPPAESPGIFSASGGILSYKDAGMWSTPHDYAQFLQMLVNGGKTSDGRQLLKRTTVANMWRDGLMPYARRDGRVPGWNDYEGKAGQKIWDSRAWSLLNTTLDLADPPRGEGPPRQGQTMWMYGGGGTCWAIDKPRRLIALSFAQCFGGWSGEEAYCLPFAREAVDEALT